MFQMSNVQNACNYIGPVVYLFISIKLPELTEHFQAVKTRNN